MTAISFPHFIDFEASGFGDKSYPIEVAWNGVGGTIESYLISPEDIEDWTYWDKEAQIDAHKITREETIHLGEPPKTVALRMNETLAGQVLYSDAPEFDGFWLSRLCEAAGMPPAFKLGSAIELFALEIHEDHKLDGTSPIHLEQRFDMIMDTLGLQAWRNIDMRPHRALHDVRHLMETYRLLIDNDGKIPSQ